MHKDLLKSVATLIVSTGVGAVVTHAVKATTPADLKTIQKIVVMIGTVAVSHAVSDVASKYTVGQMSEVAGSLKQLKAALPKKH